MNQFKVLMNTEGIYRVKISGQFMTDVDLMLMCSSNHVSKVLNFYSMSEACFAMAKYLQRNEQAAKIQLDGFEGPHGISPPEPVIADTFQEI
jgi:hypothetical protein